MKSAFDFIIGNECLYDRHSCEYTYTFVIQLISLRFGIKK